MDSESGEANTTIGEGWVLSERADGFYEIQRLDGDPLSRFVSDIAAFAYVRARANEQSPPHMDAIAKHGSRHEPTSGQPCQQEEPRSLPLAMGKLIDRLAQTAWGDRGEIDGLDAQELLVDAGLTVQRPATADDLDTIDDIEIGDTIYVLTPDAAALRRLAGSKG